MYVKAGWSLSWFERVHGAGDEFADAIRSWEVGMTM
jgi:hypothetical protein